MVKTIVKRPSTSQKRYVRAADFGYGDEEIGDAVDDLADSAEDLQDSVDEFEEDDESIEVNNNITDHYIAECDKCHGIFISAVVLSDQEVESVSGVCPLCGKESEQYLNWVIKDVADAVDLQEESEVEPEPEPKPEPTEENESPAEENMEQPGQEGE